MREVKETSFNHFLCITVSQQSRFSKKLSTLVHFGGGWKTKTLTMQLQLACNEVEQADFKLLVVILLFLVCAPCVCESPCSSSAVGFELKSSGFAQQALLPGDHLASPLFQSSVSSWGFCFVGEVCLGQPQMTENIQLRMTLNF